MRVIEKKVHDEGTRAEVIYHEVYNSTNEKLGIVYEGLGGFIFSPDDSTIFYGEDLREIADQIDIIACRVGACRVSVIC